MTSSATTPIKKRYGSFALAATAYVIGVLLFSLWSYSAHQNALRAHTDKSLVDAAFSIKEFIPEDFITGLMDGSETNAMLIDRKQQHLGRVAHQGNFSTVGVVAVNHGNFTTLIAACCNTHSSQADGDHEDVPLSTGIQTDLLRLAGAGQNDADLLTTEHPNHESLRYAVFFHALEKDTGIAYLAAQECNVFKKELAEQALRLITAGFGMLLLAIPLITLFSRTQKKSSAELSGMNLRLQHDVELQKSREAELKDAIADLERFNAVTAGRESRIIELKAEVNELLEQMKRQKRYNIDKID